MSGYETDDTDEMRGAGHAPRPALATAWLCLTLVGLVGLVGCNKSGPGDEARVPNDRDVMLFVVDTLRADHLSCYGYPRETSPQIDALAAGGVRIERAIAQSSWTAPSMVSLFTSRYVAADFKRMPAQLTLAERMKAAGYKTIGFQFNTLLDKGIGFERGFDAYFVEPGAKDLQRAVKESGDGGPRFLYFHFVEPHDPYAPYESFDVFEPTPLPAWREEAMRAYLTEHAPDLSPRDLDARVKDAAEHIAREIARYDGEVRQVDAAFSTMRQMLARQARLDRTIVVVAADHGEGLWQHREAESALLAGERADLLRVFKRTHNTLLEDSLVRVPLIFSGPGVPEGVVLPGLVANVDIVPTVLELLGLPAPIDVDGRSLVPAFAAAANGNPLPGRDLVFSHTSLFTAAQTRNGHKLIVPTDPDGVDQERYYRLTDDPEERAPTTPDEQAAGGLRKAIAGFLGETGLRSLDGEDVLDPEIEERMRQMGYLHGKKSGGP